MEYKALCEGIVLTKLVSTNLPWYVYSWLIIAPSLLYMPWLGTVFSVLMPQHVQINDIYFVKHEILEG